jgi:uncharacterized protein GlcG (DUF336 family)
MQISAPRGTLSTDATETLLRAAIQEARRLEIRVHVAVMDSAAVLVGFLSCEGAPRIAATTARHKAFTAVNTGMSTLRWKQYVESIPAGERAIIEKIEGYIAADGGYPVIEAGVLLGGVGVSGADQERDAACAIAALAAIGVSAG